MAHGIAARSAVKGASCLYARLLTAMKGLRAESRFAVPVIEVAQADHPKGHNEREAEQQHARVLDAGSAFESELCVRRLHTLPSALEFHLAGKKGHPIILSDAASALRGRGFLAVSSVYVASSSQGSPSCGATG